MLLKQKNQTATYLKIRKYRIHPNTTTTNDHALVCINGRRLQRLSGQQNRHYNNRSRYNGLRYKNTG